MRDFPWLHRAGVTRARRVAARRTFDSLGPSAFASVKGAAFAPVKQ
jgi:hypothetical protein